MSGGVRCQNQKRLCKTACSACGLLWCTSIFNVSHAAMACLSPSQSTFWTTAIPWDSLLILFFFFFSWNLISCTHIGNTFQDKKKNYRSCHDGLTEFIRRSSAVWVIKIGIWRRNLDAGKQQWNLGSIDAPRHPIHSHRLDVPCVHYPGLLHPRCILTWKECTVDNEAETPDGRRRTNARTKKKNASQYQFLKRAGSILGIAWTRYVCVRASRCHFICFLVLNLHGLHLLLADTIRIHSERHHSACLCL